MLQRGEQVSLPRPLPVGSMLLREAPPRLLPRMIRREVIQEAAREDFERAVERPSWVRKAFVQTPIAVKIE